MSNIAPYKELREDAWKSMQFGAGVILSAFDVNNPLEIPSNDDIIATTTGGITFDYTNNWTDLADGVDNAAKGMKEFRRIESTDVTFSFDSLTFNSDNIKWAIGTADKVKVSDSVTEIVPRYNVKDSDFETVYIAAPKTDGGGIVIECKNVISENGLSVKTEDGGKGTMSMSFRCCPSIYEQTKPPIKIYEISAPELTVLTVTSEAGLTTGKSEITISGYTLGSGESFKYKLGTVVEDVEYGDIIGVDFTTITSGASIDATTGQKITVVAVDADGYAIAVGDATVTAAGE